MRKEGNVAKKKQEKKDHISLDVLARVCWRNWGKKRKRLFSEEEDKDMIGGFWVGFINVDMWSNFDI